MKIFLIALLALTGCGKDVRPTYVQREAPFVVFTPECNPTRYDHARYKVYCYELDRFLAVYEKTKSTKCTKPVCE